MLTVQRVRGTTLAARGQGPVRLLSRLEGTLDFFRSSWDSAKISFAILLLIVIRMVRPATLGWNMFRSARGPGPSLPCATPW